MLKVDCRELSMDEQLALASSMSDALGGKGVALLKGDFLVVDSLGGAGVDEKSIESSVSSFIARRKDHEFYSVEREDDTIIVHSADPVGRPRGRHSERLPPNLFKCPYCLFVTPYEELYVTHRKFHGFT